MMVSRLEHLGMKDVKEGSVHKQGKLGNVVVDFAISTNYMY